ncbi:MAG: hypothetical protein ABI193_01550, partial [Minicystis sp.]
DGRKVESRTWGWKQWMIPRVFSLARLLVAARESGVDAECRQLLGRNYERYAPSMPLIPSALEVFFCSSRSSCQFYDQLAAQLAAEPPFLKLQAWAKQSWTIESGAAPAG